MELTCELSPLVYSELYRMLAADRAFADNLSERLEPVGLDLDWLGEARAAYEWRWQNTRKQFTPDTPPDGLRSDHAQLASWVLCGLRVTGPSLEFSADLADAVHERARSELSADINPMQVPSLRPVIMAWILGMVVGNLDRTLPVIPARLPYDEAIREAYLGLVEHVVHLGETCEPWSEVLGASTIWRGTGIAEAMRKDQGGQEKAINALLGAARRFLTEERHKQLIRHFRGFVDRRDVLTHLHPKPGRVTFSEARETARTWAQISPTLFGIAQFICQDLAFEYAEGPASRAVRTGTWDDLRWDLDIYDELTGEVITPI